jgi:hypothetical protein
LCESRSHPEIFAGSGPPDASGPAF